VPKKFLLWVLGIKILWMSLTQGTKQHDHKIMKNDLWGRMMIYQSINKIHPDIVSLN
jgi:hypothetical protein